MSNKSFKIKAIRKSLPDAACQIWSDLEVNFTTNKKRKEEDPHRRSCSWNNIDVMVREVAVHA